MTCLPFHMAGELSEGLNPSSWNIMDEMFTFQQRRRAIEGTEPVRVGTLWMKCLSFHMVGDLLELVRVGTLWIAWLPFQMVGGVEPVRAGALWIKCLPFHMVGELSEGLNSS